MTRTPPSIASIEPSSSGVAVLLDGATTTLTLPWFWIRDHSEDESALDPETLQRRVDTFAIDRSITAEAVEVRDEHLVVTWTDGSDQSRISAELLHSLGARAGDGRELWRSGDDPRLSDTLAADAVLTDDSALRTWLESIDRFGFGVVTGAGETIDDAQELANRIGYVRETVFGGMWTLSSEVVAHADTAYGNKTLEPHTDGSYSHDGPGMQFFVCSERTGNGGESVLVDGFAAADVLRGENPEAFEILSTVSVPGRYIEPGVHLHARRPTIRLDTNGDLQQVTFNNYDRAPFLLDEPLLSQWYAAYAAFHELLLDRSGWWMRYLEPGDGLFFDNWRCLHGRMAYDGRRVFHGGYLNHEDLESRLRVTS